MADEPHPLRIGLLFVHGIGEQERFAFLRSSVTEFAELMLQCEPTAHISVIDRTADWPLPAGEPDPSGKAPMTLTYQSELRHIDYECHEVWWADLGTRSGVGDQIMFWIWGLGQWNAPIYRDLDASQLEKSQRGYNKPVSSLTKTPNSIAGSPQEPLARLKLMVAGLAALFVGITWALAKRVLAALLSQAPTPTLIVKYVGDVRTYEERASPGSASPSDPGHPRRVGIRRRMVTEMVALGSQNLDSWYVVAHSLGTVVAYNGLTEIGHTLPNYLSQDQWKRLGGRFKRDPGCNRREKVHAMMPSRPEWLAGEDVINRPHLFAKLKGLLTFGSPLDKFAALWPRIVATATDRNDGVSPFADCWWVNLSAPHDPVGGMLKSFTPGPSEIPAYAVPKVENKATPLDWAYMLAHIRYFTGVEVFDNRPASNQKRSVMKLLLGMGSVQAIPSHPQNWLTRFLSVHLVYALALPLLWIVTSIFFALIGGLSINVFGGEKADRFQTFADFVHAVYANLGPVLGMALSLVFISGLVRWIEETWLNMKFAKLEEQGAASDEIRSFWRRILRMLRAQMAAAWLTTAIFGLPVLTGLYWDLTGLWPTDLNLPPLWTAATLAPMGIFAAAFLQSTINRMVPNLHRA